MGLLIKDNNVTISDNINTTKFTTNYRMPHILGSASTTVNVSNIAISDYVEGAYYRVNSNQYFTVASGISTLTSGEIFVFPFFQIYGGDINTNGSSLCGNGSSILRIFTNSAGSYIGSMILNTLAGSGGIYLWIKSALYTTSDFGSYNLDEADYTIMGTGLTISTKIYYGRFQ